MSYAVAQDQAEVGPDHVFFQVTRSPDGLVIFDVNKAGGVPLRLEFPPAEAIRLAHTLLAMAGAGSLVEVPVERDAELGMLSKRERELVDRLCDGMRLSEIAALWGITKNTTRNHCKHVFRKLGLRSQNSLIAKFGGRRA